MEGGIRTVETAVTEFLFTVADVLDKQFGGIALLIDAAQPSGPAFHLPVHVVLT